MATQANALQRLSEELLILVIEQVLPQDLASFAACSRRVFRLAEKRLHRHREYRTRYSKVVIANADPNQQGDYIHPALLLRDIWNDWTVAHYVKYAVYDCEDPVSSTTYEFEASQVDERVRKDLDKTEGFLDFIKSSLFLRGNDELTDQFRENIRLGIASTSAILLLTLLPNLKRFRFNTPAWDATIWPTFRACSTGRCATEVLPRLATVETYHPDSEGGSHWEDILPWAMLPAVETIASKMLLADQVESERIPASMTHQVDLQRLHFTNCEIHPEALLAMLQSIHGLKDFRYTPSVQTAMLMWEVEEFVQALVDTQAESLERLSLLLPLGAISSFDTLKPLEKLKTFEGHLDMMPVYDGHEGIRTRHHYLVKLGEIFPPSVESIMLVHGDGFLSSEQAFPQLKVEGEHELPHLHRVVYVGGVVAKECAARLKEAEIEVELLEVLKPTHAQHWVDDPPPRAW